MSIYKHVIVDITTQYKTQFLIFRLAVEQVEHFGDKLLAMCSQHNLEEYNNFQMTCNQLLERIQDIRRVMDESYKKITKHDREQLTKFQVFKQKSKLYF